MTDHTIDILRQVCQEELDDKVTGLTDGTEDIFEGRKEFATSILGLINKLERPRQKDQADKLKAGAQLGKACQAARQSARMLDKAVAASNARNEVATQYNTQWHPMPNTGDSK